MRAQIKSLDLNPKSFAMVEKTNRESSLINYKTEIKWVNYTLKCKISRLFEELNQEVLSEPRSKPKSFWNGGDYTQRRSSVN
jgi:phage pi2 protein 07